METNNQMETNKKPFRKPCTPWNGFVSVILGKEANHTNTVRYDGVFEFQGRQRTFTYYAPRPQLKISLNSEQKNAIVVHILVSPLQGKKIEAPINSSPNLVNGGAWEFQLTNRRRYRPVNSWLYDTWHEDRRYNIYVPKLIMCTTCPPNRVLVNISNVPPE